MSFRKPDSDKRNYRLITLDNEMEICLVSDPETMIAAAALAVKAGQLQDPPEVQGLAHFCEHMLFLGNEKFPGESDFDAFCASSAGYSNAWTSMDRTVYHYMLAHDRLSDSLDRFSGFFSCPLFTEDLTERELNAIESENNKDLQDDSRREHQLWRSTAKAGHPVQRFGTGNFKTLSEMPKEAGTNVREHLLRFHESCYSANVMTLSVLGREDLDTLEALVRQHFSAVPNRKLAPLAGVSPTDSAFDDGWKQLYRIVPVRERRKLCLFFPMPPTYPDFRVKMCRFISHCIGHEGPGSVLSALKARNLATELGAGTATQSTYYSLFEVSVKLTEEGLPRWEEAVSLIFQYLNSFVRDAPRAERDRIRRECTLMEELNFRFRSKAREDNFTEQLACNLSRYPRELVLCGPDLFFDPLDHDKLDTLLDTYFTPRNLRVHLTAPAAEQPGVGDPAAWEAGCEREEWYGTAFSREALPAAHAAEWGDRARPCDPALHLPPVNAYVPDSCQLKAPVRAAAPPRKIVDTAGVQAWHVLDTSFEIPKASLQIQLTNFAVERSARGAVALRMVLEMVQELTNEDAYQAEEAGLVFDITNTSNSAPCVGLRLSFKGYDQCMPTLVGNIAAFLARLQVAEHQAVYDLVKEKTLTDYRNRRFQQPYAHALTACSAVVEAPFWSSEARLAELESLTSDDVQAHLREFLAHLLVEGAVVGNMTEAEAAAIFLGVAETLGAKPLPEELRPKLCITKLAAGESLLHEEPGPDPDAVDSAICTLFQCGPCSVEQDATVDLLCQIMDKEAYAQLRTAEQLGYIVAAVPHSKWAVGGVRMIVQSVHAPQYLEGRLEAFLALFEEKLAEMPPEDYAEHVEGLVTKKLEKDRNMQEACRRVMNEVVGHTYEFERRHKEADFLRTLDKAALLAFFRAHVACGSPTRRRLACHVMGKAAVDEAAPGAAVTPESKSKVVRFAADCDPFPVPPIRLPGNVAEGAGEEGGGAGAPSAPAADSAPAPRPAPVEVLSLSDFREKAERYAEQK